MPENAFFWSSAPASPPSPSTSGVHFTADRCIQLCFHGMNTQVLVRAFHSVLCVCVFVFVHVIYCFKYSQVIVGESVCVHYSSIGDVCCG